MGGLISDEYRDQLRSVPWSGGGYKWAGKIVKRAKIIRSPAGPPASILDYGCGSGSLKKELKDWDVREYDPGVVGKDALPDPADIVACIDVMEHIEPDKLAAVLQHIYSLTASMAFFVIATRPAEKRLPDGRNAHLIIDNPAWWVEQLKAFAWGFNSIVVEPGELTLWATKE